MAEDNMSLLLLWNRACNVGVRAMDNQHAIMMDTMNELRLEAIGGGKRVQKDALLAKLIELTRTHFRAEEQLLAQYRFPGLTEHRVAHQRELAHLQEFATRLQHGEAVNLDDFLGFLHHWFIDHVAGVDQKYGPWLNDRGVY